jgi:hypothetical protein
LLNLIFTIIIVAGLVVMMVPPDRSERIIEAREYVESYGGTCCSTSIDIHPGEYQVWAPDIDPDGRDYRHFLFSIHDLDGEVDVQYSNGSVVEDIDGVPHELYCTFVLEHGGLYFYDTGCDEVGGEAEYFVIVFTRESRWTDGPGVLIGLVMVIAGIIALIVTVGERYARRDFTGQD